MKKQARFWIAIAIVSVFVITAFSMGRLRRAAAFNPQPDPPGRYATLGLVQGQSIRINASNIAPTDPNSPPDPCRVRLAFVDGDGNALTNPRTGEAVRRTVTLQNGQSTFLNLNADEFFNGDVTATRLQLRPVFRSETLNSEGKAPPDPCTPSVEVLDNATLKTSFVYEGTPWFTNPPDPDRQQ